MIKKLFLPIMLMLCAEFILSSFEKEMRIYNYYLYDICKECFFSYSKDTVSRITSDKKYILLNFKDTIGSAWFYMRERSSSRKTLCSIEGYYSDNAIKYDTIINLVVYGDTGKIKKKAYYYKPLRDGLWKYFDVSGRLIKIETYNKGVLISTKIN